MLLSISMFVCYIHMFDHFSWFIHHVCLSSHSLCWLNHHVCLIKSTCSSCCCKKIPSFLGEIQFLSQQSPCSDSNPLILAGEIPISLGELQFLAGEIPISLGELPGFGRSTAPFLVNSGRGCPSAPASRRPPGPRGAPPRDLPRGGPGHGSHGSGGVHGAKKSPLRIQLMVIINGGLLMEDY